MRLIRSLFIAIFAIALTACAHNISLSSDLSKMSPVPESQKINKNVGYFIASDLMTKEVTTPGGGGDKVTYYPYKDIETGFYQALSNVFTSVTKLKSVNDTEANTKYALKLVIQPTITTTSSSPSPLTWPPTKFGTELTCRFTDLAGNLIFETTVVGNGAAEFDEFKKDLSLSARRSTEAMLNQLQTALINSPELKK